MAKFTLIFICIFLMVQWSLAARVVRDAPVETPTKSEGSDPSAFINDALASITQGLQKTFSKQNIDQLMQNLGEAGDKLKELGQTFINRAQETAADIANSGKSKDEAEAKP